MTLTAIAFPICDLRRFIPDSGQIRKPSWPIPSSGSEFVRRFGAIRERIGGGLSGWVGENSFCDARRALRLDDLPGIPEGNPAARQAVSYRRFYSDGLALAKFELATAITCPPEEGLSREHIEEYVCNFMRHPVRVPDGRGGFRQPELANAGRSLAQLYGQATTKDADATETATQQNTWVRAGSPIILLRASDEDATEIPFGARWVNIHSEYLSLYCHMLNYSGRHIRLWIVASHPQESQHEEVRSELRRLRIYLLRLHAEHECLRVVLQLLQSGELIVRPRSDESNFLQRYFNEATRRIGILETKSDSQFQDAICRIARSSYAKVSPGEREGLELTLDRLEMRPNIREKIGDHIIQNLEVIVGDKNVVRANNVAYVGSSGRLENVNFVERWDSARDDIDLRPLAAELKRLREQLEADARTDEEATTAANVKSAEDEARKGNGAKVLEFLAKAGSKVLEAATKVGAEVAVAAMHRALGPGV